MTESNPILAEDLIIPRPGHPGCAGPGQAHERAAHAPQRVRDPNSGLPLEGEVVPSRHLLTNCQQPSDTGDESPSHLSSRDCRIGDTLGEILHNPLLEPYYDEVCNFINWIEKTKNITIILKGYSHYPDQSGDIQPFTEFGYRKKTATRWSDDYTNILLARLYKLQDATRGTPVIMASFTVPHEYNRFRELKNPGMHHLACFDLLKTGWDKFRKRLQDKYGHVSYVKVWEAHPATGYPHFHAALFGTFTDDDRTWLKSAWADCIGYPRHADTALDISETRKIDHPLAYMMKYLSKTLYDGWQDWTPEEWVFNALLWTTGTRSFQPSRDLGHLMKPDERPDTHNVYTHILAEGLPRKIEENAHLPVSIATPSSAIAKYEREASLNPGPAPFLPLSANNSPDFMSDRSSFTPVPLTTRIQRFTAAHGLVPVMIGGFVSYVPESDLDRLELRASVCQLQEVKP